MGEILTFDLDRHGNLTVWYDAEYFREKVMSDHENGMILFGEMIMCEARYFDFSSVKTTKFIPARSVNGQLARLMVKNV